MSNNVTLDDNMIGVGKGILHNLRQTLARDLGDRAAVYLQEAGCAAGEQVYESFLRWLPDFSGVAEPGDLDARTLSEVLSAFFEALGWGSLRVEETGKGALIITAPEWAESEAGGDAPQPSCYVTSGILTDFLGRLSAAPVAVMEVECRTRADAHCRFVAGAPETLEAVFNALANGDSYDSVLNS